MTLKELLEGEFCRRNTTQNLQSFADPLIVASQNPTPQKALICALFSYGNAEAIVKFLRKIDFEILEQNEEQIRLYARKNRLLYRFESVEDVAEILVLFSRLKGFDFEGRILEGMARSGEVIDGLNALVKELYRHTTYRNSGFEFWLGKPFEKSPKSPYKRLNMWLRWMVRDGQIDLGLFRRIDKSRLILPLDVHTHRVCLRLGLCPRKSYDFAAAKLTTQNLAAFDAADPVKYDFALYRIGQSKELDEICQKLQNG